MSIELGNCAKYIMARNFLKKSQVEFVRSLKSNYDRVTEYSLEAGQEKAWKNCYDVLHAVFSQLSEPYGNLWLVFEYVLPCYNPESHRFQSENHIRADVLLVAKDSVLVLEFKQRAEPFIGLYRQARKYRNRIANYHASSIGMNVEALLVLTGAHQFCDQEEGITGCSPDLLSNEIRRLMGDTPNPHHNIKGWLQSRFYDIAANTVNQNSMISCDLCCSTEYDHGDYGDDRLVFYSRSYDDTQHLYCFDMQTDDFYYMDHCWTGEGVWYKRDDYPTFPVVEISKERAIQIAKGKLYLPTDEDMRRSCNS